MCCVNLMDVQMKTMKQAQSYWTCNYSFSILKTIFVTQRCCKVITNCFDLYSSFFYLRELVSGEVRASRSQVCLIFAGKFLKDESHNQEGFTVHLVIKSSPSGSAHPNNTACLSHLAHLACHSLSCLRPTTSSHTKPMLPSPLQAWVVLGKPGTGELQQRMQREMLTHPEMMRQIMTIPLNPDISPMLNHPEWLNRLMELARNPAMLQELMRSHAVHSPLGFHSGPQYQLETILMRPQAGRENATPSRTPGLKDHHLPPPPRLLRHNRPPHHHYRQSTNTSPPTTMGSKQNLVGRGCHAFFSSPGMQSPIQQIMENPQLMVIMINLHTHNYVSALA
ncbi:ubiquilin-2-like [Penaeus indicus]|uniref:ubiquilin-2-like n=1 Tax=Penaeus indicus TaxID=29960 RepID=UPI00300C878C